MKILKAIAIFLIFVFCFGFIAGLFKGSDINSGLSFIGNLIGKVTEESTENLQDVPIEKPSEVSTSDSTESTEETTVSEGTTASEETTEETSGEVDFSQLSMNCLGDSVTRGECGENNCSYIPELMDILNLNICRNYSKGGSPITDIGDYSFIDRYPDMDDNADIILVFGGFNDYGKCSDLGAIDSTDPNTFYGALNTLVLGLREKYPDAYIFLIIPYKMIDSETGQAREGDAESRYGFTHFEFNDAINAVGEKHGIDVLDLWPLEINTDSLIDTVHPTCDFANNVLAPTIAQFIKDNYKKPN